ncbi:MAG: restriction endonuclease [Chlorobi bacterium]|nr:restriction endonuclease [Chlorobiota bacterium]
MEYLKFKSIFNEIIFEKSKADLITKVAKYPQRYIGLFRPTKPKAKLLQNLLQSHEIRFGDAFEKLIEEYLIELGYEILDKSFDYGNGDKLNVDQFFKNDEYYFFVEQKVRDDHDSTKKRGQISNFEKKLETIINIYGDDRLKGFFYFIDPDLVKNKNFYKDELDKMSADYGVELYICYGKEFFDLINESNTWLEIIKYLKKWRSELPDTPEINFDLEPEQSFEEIKDLSPSIYRKLFDNEELYKEIVLTIFPEKKTLVLLKKYFETKEKKIYKTLVDKLEDKGIK